MRDQFDREMVNEYLALLWSVVPDGHERWLADRYASIRERLSGESDQREQNGAQRAVITLVTSRSTAMQPFIAPTRNDNAVHALRAGDAVWSESSRK